MNGNCSISFSNNDTYSVVWSGQSSGNDVVINLNSYTIQDLPSGDYTVLVTNSFGCTSVCNFTVDLDTNGNNCNHPDFEDLMNLYNSTNGSNWTNNTGWKDGAAGTNCDPCGWYGISCDPLNKRVTQIQLPSNNLRGPIVIFSGLDSLNFIDLSTNFLTNGNWNFTNNKLKGINLLWNKSLKGSIPNLNLPNLEELLCQGDSLSGPLPPFDKLPKLRSFFAGENQISGNIPSYITLDSLRYLSLENNKLTGAIPSFQSMNKLISLTLNNNQLIGGIQPYLNMSLLDTIDFGYNNLSQCFPDGNRFCNLGYYNFIGNRMMPYEGDYAKICPPISTIQLNAPCDDNNSLTENDKINSFCECKGAAIGNSCTHPDFAELMKLYNSTGGPNWTNNTGWKEGAAGTNCDPCGWYGIECENNRVISIEMDGLLNSNYDYDKGGNNLVGELPDLKFEKLKVFNLTNNKLIGGIPFFDFPELIKLHLGLNQLNGIVPNFELEHIEEIDLTSNKISGIIPKYELKKLKFLSLGGNLLTGEIPNFNTPNLEELFLDNNNLNGSFPELNLPKLKWLALSHNELKGQIQFINMPFLEVLFLRFNNFEGMLPNLDLPNLYSLLLNDNNFSGCIPISYKSLCSKVVNISNNPLLSTQSWDDFCANNEGGCYDCSAPVIADKIRAVPINTYTTLNILEGGEIPDTFSIEIINIKNDIFETKNLSENGDFTFSFKEHFLGSVEVEFEICGLPCKSCSRVKLIITDEYVPIIVPTSVMTPNGDGQNDVLRFNDESEIFNSELSIFNRWGDRIYSRKEYTNDWNADGYPGGVYFYILKVKDVVLKNTLTIIK